MSQTTDYAQSIVTALEGADVKATTNPRTVNLPGVLVVPVPARSYDVLCGYTATWTAVCLAPGVGDLNDAETLEELADAVKLAVPAVDQVDPASYVLPGYPDPTPALLCRWETTITEDDTP